MTTTQQSRVRRTATCPRINNGVRCGGDLAKRSYTTRRGDQETITECLHCGHEVAAD